MQTNSTSVSGYHEDIRILNDLAYLRIFRGKEIKESFKTAKRLLEAKPALLALRVTVALGWLRRDNPKRAMELFNGLSLHWRPIKPAWRVALAGVLQANGHTEGAMTLLTEVNPSRLRPEERTLYNAVSARIGDSKVRERRQGETETGGRETPQNLRDSRSLLPPPSAPEAVERDQGDHKDPGEHGGGFRHGNDFAIGEDLRPDIPAASIRDSKDDLTHFHVGKPIRGGSKDKAIVSIPLKIP